MFKTATILRPVSIPGSLYGQSMPCDLFNARGTLLLKAGTVLSQRTGAYMPSQRVFCQAHQAGKISKDNPAVRLNALAEDLSTISQAAEQNDYVSEQRLRQLATALYAVWEMDADFCIGYCRLQQFSRPSIRHCLLAALLTLELCAANGMEKALRQDIAGAALTMNLNSMTLHDQWYASPAALDRQQKNAIELHPVNMAMWLRRIGMRSQVWLDTITQHHEDIDGRGYPWGLKGTQISIGGRVVRIADMLAARMIGCRHRALQHWNIKYTRSVTQWMQHIFGNDLGRLDKTLVRMLLQRLGYYMPGSLVRLASRQTAVIARRDGTESIPVPRQAVVLTDNRMNPLPFLQARELNPQDMRLMTFADDEAAKLKVADWQTVWGYGYQDTIH